MAQPIITNPNVADRANSTWWGAPIGVGLVLPNPVFMSDLPTSDPAIPGQLWCDTANANVIKESDGTP